MARAWHISASPCSPSRLILHAGRGACCPQSPYGNAYCNGECCAGQCVASNVTGQNFTCMPGDVASPNEAPGPQIY